MSQELVKVPTALTVTAEESKAVQAAYAVNVANGSISQADLPRIKIVSGTALWLIPKLEGEETAPKIEGVIVYARDARVYFKKTATTGNVPPDCSSADGITGKGSPGGECASCPLAEWGSAEDEHGNKQKGQGCKQVKQLFMLRGESAFPELVILPPTSLQGVRRFFLQLTTQGIPYYGALVAIELQKATNAQNKPYGKAAFKFIRKLNLEEVAAATGFYAMCEQMAGRLQQTAPEAGPANPAAPAPATNDAASSDGAF